MRSNHAGETGAVEIYNGALWALRFRGYIRAAVGVTSKGEYDERLRAFCEEHRASEQHHLDLLNEVLEPPECSRLLPVWWVAGRSLGAISTLWCSRGM
jgi:ubiquinone biosynthesis monooxygenase Coq7